MFINRLVFFPSHPFKEGIWPTSTALAALDIGSMTPRSCEVWKWPGCAAGIFCGCAAGGCLLHSPGQVEEVAMDHLYIPFLGGWTSILTQLWLDVNRRGIGFWPIPMLEFNSKKYGVSKHEFGFGWTSSAFWFGVDFLYDLFPKKSKFLWILTILTLSLSQHGEFPKYCHFRVGTRGVFMVWSGSSQTSWRMLLQFA